MTVALICYVTSHFLGMSKLEVKKESIIVKEEPVFNWIKISNLFKGYLVPFALFLWHVPGTNETTLITAKRIHGLIMLLIHMDAQDDEMGSIKYGQSVWSERFWSHNIRFYQWILFFHIYIHDTHSHENNNKLV